MILEAEHTVIDVLASQEKMDNLKNDRRKKNSFMAGLGVEINQLKQTLLVPDRSWNITRVFRNLTNVTLFLGGGTNGAGRFEWIEKFPFTFNKWLLPMIWLCRKLSNNCICMLAICDYTNSTVKSSKFNSRGLI